MDQTPELTEVEMVEILKHIAREGGNAAARIAAIRELRIMRGTEKQDEGEHATLYALPARRSGAA